MNDEHALAVEHAALQVQHLAEALAIANSVLHEQGLTIAAHVKTIESQAAQATPTKDRIKEIAVAMAVKVAKNAGTVPQLCFPDIYLDLTELFAGQAAQGAVPEAPRDLPEATHEIVGRAALYEFCDKYCLNQPALVACAESAFYWFNKVAASTATIPQEKAQ